MSRDNLYVAAHQSQWEVRTDEEQGDSDMPRYDSREEAIDAAILSAENSGKRGRHGHVYVEEPDGTFRLEKTVEPAGGQS